MRKIFLLFFWIFLFFSYVFASDDIRIITREEWWANDSFMDKNWPEWTNILTERAKNAKPLTPAQIEAREKSKEKTRKINAYIMQNFWKENEISGTDKYYKWKELIWPIEHSSKIRAIVVHHTHSDYADSYDWIRRIYRYHALTNGRWDIWYNFLIWKNWEIFEWRAGWETAVGAHSLRNNRQTIGISLIWNYDKEPISDAQYASLEKLIKYLVDKYHIDLNSMQPFNRNCTKNCVNPLETVYNYPIVWHRDTGHTDCPGQKLYDQLEKIRFDISGWKISTPNLTYNSNKNINTNSNLASSNSGYSLLSFPDDKTSRYFKIFDQVWEQKLLEAMLKIEKMLETNYRKDVAELKSYIVAYFKQKDNYNISNRTADKKIKVKLSYPENLDFITLTDWLADYKIEKYNWKLLVNGEEKENFSISNGIRPYVEITSWDRTPVWDREKIYKDNKFRWEIFIYLKNDKFVVVNNLPLEDYLKWLWEISNSENTVKAEAILISARTYALWYIEKDRKFPGELYDASDDPDIFQKYIWYDLELRSPNLNKILDNTKWVVLTYNWELIKPWYFSSSTGKTLSFYEYCLKNNNSQNYCETEKSKYPFLNSKDDPGWIGKTQSGHWVWMSGTWATYFSSKWWTSSMILKYFYDWIQVK